MDGGSMRMNSKNGRARWQYAGILLAGGLCCLAMGGCPIDQNTILTQTLQAALEATVKSFVDAFSAYLANR